MILSPVPVARRLVRATTGAAAVAIVLAGCGGSPSDSATSATAGTTSQTSSAPASPTSRTPSASPSTSPSTSPAAAVPIAATPPAEPVELADACTGEGAYRLAPGGAVDPALPARDGATLTLALTGTSGAHGDPAAQLTASLDGDAPRPVEPLAVGDSVGIGDWTLSITSVCPDAVEFDLLD